MAGAGRNADIAKLEERGERRGKAGADGVTRQSAIMLAKYSTFCNRYHLPRIASRISLDIFILLWRREALNQ